MVRAKGIFWEESKFMKYSDFKKQKLNLVGNLNLRVDLDFIFRLLYTVDFFLCGLIPDKFM